MSEERNGAAVIPPVEHKALPVHGYQPQSDEKVAIVNAHKEHEEMLLRRIEVLARSGTCDGRWLAIARTHLEQGFMALNRAVFQPGRVRLPGDDT